MGVWDDYMTYLQKREIVDFHKYAPFYLASIGAHIANLHNKGFIAEWMPFYMRQGKILDLRIHLFSVAPPGFGKTFWIEELCDVDRGILIDTGIPAKFQGKVTLKGLVGGYNQKGVRTFGIAETLRNGIFGIEEWEQFMGSSKQEHSSDFEDNMLMLLDSGRVVIVRGDYPRIDYQSFMTIIAGTQSERFNLATGMARRMTLVDMSPDRQTRKAMSDAYDKGEGIRPDMEAIKKIRNGIANIQERFQVRRVEFSPSYLEMRNKLSMEDHLLKGYLDRFAIGYTVMRSYRFQDELVILQDKPLEQLMRALVQMKFDTLGGLSEAMVLKILAEDEWKLADLKKYLVGFGCTYQSASRLISSMAEVGRLMLEKRDSPGNNKKTTFVKKSCFFEEPDWAAFLRTG